MISEKKPSSNQPKDEDFTKDYQKKKKEREGTLLPHPRNKQKDYQ